MAEITTEQKPRTRKPRAPKPIIVETESVELEKLPAEPGTVEAEPEVPAEVTENSEEITKDSEVSVEVTEIPAGELAEQPAAEPEEQEILSGPAEIAKLNPNLSDDRSKWIARLVAERGYHVIFKGSLAKAYRAADNYNKMHGFPANKVRKVRQ